MTGTSTASVILRTTESIWSRPTVSESGSPKVRQMPPLVVAIAANLLSAKMRALAASHAFGNTRIFRRSCNLSRAWALALMSNGFTFVHLRADSFRVTRKFCFDALIPVCAVAQLARFFSRGLRNSDSGTAACGLEDPPG